MQKFSKGDYIDTIPLQTVFVKRRYRDDRNRLWYKVLTPSNSIYHVPRTLVKGLANKKQVALFKTKQKQYNESK